MTKIRGVVGHVWKAAASFGIFWAEHEMVHNELLATFEQAEHGDRTVGSVEDRGLGDLDKQKEAQQLCYCEHVSLMFRDEEFFKRDKPFEKGGDLPSTTLSVVSLLPMVGYVPSAT